MIIEPIAKTVQSTNASPATNNPARLAPGISLLAAPVNCGTAEVVLEMISDTLLDADALVVAATTTTLVDVEVITLAVLVTVAFANGTSAAAAL